MSGLTPESKSPDPKASSTLSVRPPGQSTDPIASWTLELIIGCTLLGLAISVVTGGSALRDVVLKGAGGLLLVLASYYAARTLKENRAEKRVDQMLTAFELTAHKSASVHGGAVHVLLNIAEDISRSTGPLEKGRIEAIVFSIEPTKATFSDANLWTPKTVGRLNALRVMIKPASREDARSG